MRLNCSLRNPVRLSSHNEAELLASQSSTAVQSNELDGLPFQVEAENLTQMRHTTTAELALALAENLLKNPNDATKIQAYFSLQMVVDSTRVKSQAEISFGSLLNGSFHVEQDEDGYYIVEQHRDGFAAEVLHIMRMQSGQREHAK